MSQTNDEEKTEKERESRLVQPQKELVCKMKKFCNILIFPVQIPYSGSMAWSPNKATLVVALFYWL